MAATSHDFWLANLSPKVWKRLHMLVYVAYWLVLGHVALGILQSERHWALATLMLTGAATITALHAIAGMRELRRDTRGQAVPEATDCWIDIGDVDDIADNAAKVVCLRRREYVTVFRYDNKISAVSNACAHTRAAPSARAASSTAASHVPGTDISTSQTMAKAPRPTPRRFPPTKFVLRADASCSILTLSLPAHPYPRPTSPPYRRLRHDQAC